MTESERLQYVANELAECARLAGECTSKDDLLKVIARTERAAVVMDELVAADAFHLELAAR